MFYFLAEDGKMKNQERGEGGNILLFHEYRLRWQLVPALCFPPKTLNGSREQRKASHVEIRMAMMEGFLRSWWKLNRQLAPKIWFEVRFYVQARATSWVHFSKAMEANVSETGRRGQHLLQNLQNGLWSFQIFIIANCWVRILSPAL